MLQKLMIHLGTEITTDEQSLDMLEAILSSWDADVSQQDIFLFPFAQKDFTRQAYADLLRKMGQVLEGWLQGFRVCVRLYDREVWKAWWRTHIKECFPTFAKSRRLHIISTSGDVLQSYSS